jgi:hypothetical protein
MVSVETAPNPLTQRGVHPLPGAIQAELPEAVVDAAPGREVVGEQAPRTAAPYDIEDGVNDLAQGVETRTSGGFGSGKVRLQAAPFGVGEVGWICCSHASYRVPLPAPDYPFLDSSGREILRTSHI